MDETNGATKNTTQKEGQASGSEGGTPQEPLTHTQAQVDEALQKDRIARGRDDKALQAREATVAVKEAEAERIQKERDAEELAAAQGNPLALDALQLKKDRAELAKSKVEHQADIESAREAKRETEIWHIATKYGVDAETLKGLNLDKEHTEVVAKAMSGSQTNEDGTPKKPDSGVTIGGVGWRDLSSDDKIRRALNKK